MKVVILAKGNETASSHQEVSTHQEASSHQEALFTDLTQIDDGKLSNYEELPNNIANERSYTNVYSTLYNAGIVSAKNNNQTVVLLNRSNQHNVE